MPLPLRPCDACGHQVRGRVRALVVPDGRKGRVCSSCASTGVLVVARIPEPPSRQVGLFDDTNLTAAERKESA